MMYIRSLEVVSCIRMQTIQLTFSLIQCFIKYAFDILQTVHSA